MDSLTDDELKAEHRRACLLLSLARTHGRMHSTDHYGDLKAVIEAEARTRGLDL